MRKTAIFKDNLFMEHDPGYDHVESPDRLRVIYEMLEKPELQKLFVFPGANPASHDILEMNHTPELVARIASTAGSSFDMLDQDTRTSAKSYDAACLAAGSLVEGVRMLVDGEADNAFALVRPPGHHAEKNQAMGFCLFNNVAIGAHYAIEHLGLKRVLIVDWDLHHGNGTQHSFYDTDKVLYFSTHQYPYYPGSGAASEIGAGAGKGFTVNVPLPGGMADSQYARIFNEILIPVARQYQPELILVSAGFDIAMGDPLGSMNITSEGFAYMAHVLLGLADELCNGRLLLTLEGGYNLQNQLKGVLAVLTVLVGRDFLKQETLDLLTNSDTPLTVIDQVQDVLRDYWKFKTT
ncbi:MAG: histone deacetylase [Thermodesulfobacteriota bacterium]|nr:histone deacetylase [Thermodesulfobacteriota bacterium]